MVLNCLMQKQQRLLKVTLMAQVLECPDWEPERVLEWEPEWEPESEPAQVPGREGFLKKRLIPD